MSGIAGILHLHGAPVERQLLQRLIDSLDVRGPDAQALWLDGAIGLCHTLLRTTDESAHEQQPLSLDGQVWIVADGRIDDRQALIRQLETKGSAPSDLPRHPDCELILRAYLAWGEACVEHLLGDFAFAIWDGRQRKLFCARDHHGIKPFYYAHVGDCLVFSNSLDCLRQHPLVSGRLNDQAMGDFLLFGLNSDLGTTFFADVQRLPGGHCLTVFDREVRQRRYWSLPVRELIRYKRAREYIDHFKHLIDQAVADRLRTADVSILLSGGLDSTAVAAVAVDAAAKRGQPLHLRPITGLFDQIVQDQEDDFARSVTATLGVPLQLTSFAPDTLQGAWKQADNQPPEPQFHLIPLGTVFHCAQIPYDRVMLFGHGSDLGLRASPQTVPSMLKAMPARDVLADVVRSYRLLHSRPPFGLNLRQRIQGRRGSRPDIQADVHFPGATHPMRYPAWLNGSFERRLALDDRWDQVVRTAKYPIDSLRAPAFWEYNSPYEVGLHEWVDQGVSNLVTDFRFPFLDLRLVEFMVALPPYPWCENKGLLRVAMRDRLPHTVLERPKTALPTNPLIMLLANDLEPIQKVAAMPELDPYIDAGKLLQVGATLGRGWEAPTSLRLLTLACWLRHRA